MNVGMEKTDNSLKEVTSACMIVDTEKTEISLREHEHTCGCRYCFIEGTFACMKLFLKNPDSSLTDQLHILLFTEKTDNSLKKTLHT